MVWIRLWISCIVFLTVSGGFSLGIIKLAEKYIHLDNPMLSIILQKISWILYWCPIPFLCVCISRMSYNYKSGVMAISGEFICSTVPDMTIVFNILGGVWVTGFLISVIKAIIKKYYLYKLQKGNVPVSKQRYVEIFESCKQQFKVYNVTLWQNDLLSSPITMGIVNHKIVLPFDEYTDKELFMIYGHELTHIANKDIGWRVLGLVTSCIHWFNPIVCKQLNELRKVVRIFKYKW